MRAGVNECVQEPLTPTALGRGGSSAVARQPAATGGASVRVRRRQGRRRDDDRGGEHRDDAGTCSPRPRCSLIDLHLAHGDAALLLGVEPRFSVIDALENVHRVDESFFSSVVEKTKAGVDLLARLRSDRMTTAAVDPKRVRALIEFARRRIATSCSTSRDPTRRCSTPWRSPRRSRWSPTRSCRRCASAGRLAASLRTRYGAARVKTVMNRFDRRRDRAQRRRARHRRHGQAPDSRATTGWRSGAERRPAGRTRARARWPSAPQPGRRSGRRRRSRSEPRAASVFGRLAFKRAIRNQGR